MDAITLDLPHTDLQPPLMVALRDIVLPILRSAVTVVPVALGVAKTLTTRSEASSMIRMTRRILLAIADATFLRVVEEAMRHLVAHRTTAAQAMAIRTTGRRSFTGADVLEGLHARPRPTS
jgi:hypothetical protein